MMWLLILFRLYLVILLNRLNNNYFRVLLEFIFVLITYLSDTLTSNKANIILNNEKSTGIIRHLSSARLS